MIHHSRFCTQLIGFGLLTTVLAAVHAAPSVFPTGTTIYHPDKAWSGYTIFNAAGRDAALIDMNGRELRRWSEIWGYPPRILPGGYLMGGIRPRPQHLETIGFAQQDWDGNIVWRYDGTEQVQTAAGETVSSARQHHDWQREGNPVGYYAPGAEALVDRGRTLILAHKNVIKPEISDKLLEDDYIYEISWDGELLWEWLASDHVDEFGFSEAARDAIRRSPNYSEERGSGDWIHVNSASYIGPNHWYDSGDERFNPANVIISMRQANIVAIIARDGSVVWRIGPDARESDVLSELGQISGQHHPHIIPEGLPGAGNLLIFDNGGTAGYGAPSPGAPAGQDIVTRFYSRLLELNPVTFEKI